MRGEAGLMKGSNMQSKKGKRSTGKKSKRTVKPRRNKTTLKQRALLVIFGISLLAVLEIVLQIISFVGGGSRDEGDPFVGFSTIHPLFVSSRAGDGSRLMKTATGKLSWFNIQEFPALKTPETFRIITLGGSTTYGRPFGDATSFSGWLRKLLNRADDSPTSFEVINAGGISYASYRVVNVLKEFLSYEPDLFVIYTGHNEFLEARTYSDFLEQPSLLFKGRQALSYFKTYRLLTGVYRSAKGEIVKNSGPGSESRSTVLSPEVRTILDRSAGLDYYQRDSLFSRGVFEHFRYNVARMISLCREAGVPVVFLEPVDNIKDFSPFKSQHRPGLDRGERMSFGQMISAGFSSLNESRTNESLARFREAVKIDSLHADCHFYLGRAYLASGDTAAAGEHLIKARELDVCPLRAQAPIHNILREFTSGREIPALLDLPFLFSRLSPGGLTGEEILIDHIHPLPWGNLLIAVEIMKWMNEQGFVQDNRLSGPDELNVLFRREMNSLPPEYFRRGTINLAKVLIWAKKFRETYIVLESQWERLAEEGEAQYLMGSSLMRLGKPEQALPHFEKALALAPEHHMALIRLAELYQVLDRKDNAKAAYETILKRHPDNNAMLSNYAGLLGRMGQTDSALAIFGRIISQEPDLPRLNSNIGMVYFEAGDYNKAINAFKEAAAREKPVSPDIFYNAGKAYARLENLQEAEKFLLEAIRRNPVYLKAHIDLGNLYRDTGRPVKAGEEYRIALSINPNNPVLYVNLANIYKLTGKNAEARIVARRGLEQFPENLRLSELVQ
jgi:tetratricopeptide (TPR) repeat protein